MSVYSGPEVLNTNLVLSVDAGNIKSYPYREAITNHGYAEWYCFASGTAVYSIVDPNVSIFQNAGGVITTVVSPSANPQRGTITVTAGNKYYGNGPIFLVVEDLHHSIAPVTLAYNSFIYLANRAGAEAGTVYFYAPFDAATVTMYTGGTGINGTATSTISLTKGQAGTFTINALNWYYFKSTTPVVGTAGQLPTAVDKTILSPATTTSYQRYINSYVTLIGGATPTTISNYVIADTTYPVMAQNIGDGSGGDATQGLGYEYLSTNYSFGNVLSDYVIAAPYESTTVVTSYWSGTAWVVWETHTLTGGSKLSPVGLARDGTVGPGLEATNINGSALNMASGATLWKWVGNNPFYLCINDSADDEMSMLGWTTSSERFTRGIENRWFDVSPTLLASTPTNGPTYVADFGGYLNFDSTRLQHVVFPSTPAHNITNNITLDVWLNIASFVNVGGILTYGSGSGEQYALWTTSGNGIAFSTNWPNTWYIAYSNTLSINTWYNIVVTFTAGAWKFYKNGVLDTSGTFAISVFPTVASSYLTVGVNHPGGAEYYNGKISSSKIYNTALTAAQITDNFNSLRGRYGI